MLCSPRAVSGGRLPLAADSSCLRMTSELHRISFNLRGEPPPLRGQVLTRQGRGWGNDALLLECGVYLGRAVEEVLERLVEPVERIPPVAVVRARQALRVLQVDRVQRVVQVRLAVLLDVLDHLFPLHV